MTKDVELYYFSLLFGIIMMYLTILEFYKVQEKTSYSPPYFEFERQKLIESLQINKNELENYKEIIFHDTFFGIFYATVYWSLVNLNSNNYLQKIGSITIPLHVLLDWTENYLLFQILDNYITNDIIVFANEYLIISNIKWFFAFINSLLSITAIFT